MTDHFNEAAEYMDMIGRRHELGVAFNDLLTMSLCSYHKTNIKSNLLVKDAPNEELYMQTIAKYSKEHINIFPKILAKLHLQVFDDPYSDILGHYYTERITKGQNGQYFTPGAICEILAKLQGAGEDVEHKTVYDPACGSGRLLMCFAKHAPRNYFFGNDKNETCAKMAALNFFINGMVGEVACMDSLSMEWSCGWQINTDGIGITPIHKDQSRIWTAPPEPQKIILPSENPDDPAGKPGAQLDLF